MYKLSRFLDYHFFNHRHIALAHYSLFLNYCAAVALKNAFLCLASSVDKLKNESWSRFFHYLRFELKQIRMDPRCDYISVSSFFNFFQHPFINKELDSKPIRDLLLEYKAEVVEEEVVDEDTDVSLFSIILFLINFNNATCLLVVRKFSYLRFD